MRERQIQSAKELSARRLTSMLRQLSRKLLRPGAAFSGLQPGASGGVRGYQVTSGDQVRKNAFKAAIAKGDERQIGLWTGLRSTLVAEMLSHVSGFDWFVIDMEHSPNELNDVLLQLQASQHGNAEPVVRVPINEPVIVKRVLDIGAQSIIFPMVNTAEEAAAAVAATRYPSDGGVRGVMSLARMNNYGAANAGNAYYTGAADELCVIVQIETATAVANIEEIAAVDGVDALFIGPSDLSASMGHIGNPGHPEVRDAIEGAFAKIKKSGKAGGFLSANHDDCRWVLGMGAEFCAVGSDVAVRSTLSPPPPVAHCTRAPTALCLVCRSPPRSCRCCCCCCCCSPACLPRR
jgi:4-hydroxy-2-oxoheptanedioate aldolase